MKTVDPKDRLVGDWEPSQLPDLRPDAPSTSPPRMGELELAPPEAPSLCAQGPCAHYHELVYELDANQPLDQSETTTKTHRVRTCYPSSGVEMPLDAPVFECNLWDPVIPADRLARGDAYLQTDVGKAYLTELTVWKLEQERIRKEEAEFAAQPMAELSVLEELKGEMEPFDRLELLTVSHDGGMPRYTWNHPSIAVEAAQVTTAWTLFVAGVPPGKYKARLMRQHNPKDKTDPWVFVSIRTLTIDPKETA
jgi:hypothetical protein